MWSSLLSLAGALGARQGAGDETIAAGSGSYLLIGGGPTGTISTATFDGTNFKFLANNTIAGTSPSWLLYKDPGLVYAVDENSNNTRLFNLNTTTNELILVQNATGSSGVVSLEFSIQRTRMVGAAFGQGQIDVWDVSAPDGSMVLMKQIASNDTLGPNAARQDAPHPHQALLENSGRFFVVNDLGTDTILVIDSLEDAFEVVNHVRVPDAGCGPRHGAFFPVTGADFPTAYLLVCEMLNLVEVFALNFTTGNVTFTPVQSISTYGADFPPVNASTATAGEITISADNQDVYVSNRNSGNATDSISHFSIAGAQGSSGLDVALTFVESISSGGLVPRMISLGEDEEESVVFAANQDGTSGLSAIPRGANGAISTEEAPPSAELSVFGAPGQGPQYVQQIPITVTSSST